MDFNLILFSYSKNRIKFWVRSSWSHGPTFWLGYMNLYTILFCSGLCPIYLENHRYSQLRFAYSTNKELMLVMNYYVLITGILGGSRGALALVEE